MKKKVEKSSTKIERVPSGVSGLDKLIEGGFEKGSSFLVTGSTGTGKSTFCIGFLYNGAKNFNEPGVYLSFEEAPEDIIRDASRFGWDMDSLINSNMISLCFVEPYRISEMFNILQTNIERINAKRAVIDSTSVFGLYLKDPHEVRKKIYELVRLLKRAGVTALLTAEITEESSGLSRFGVEEFVVDGVIVMHFLGVGAEYHRSLLIRKMRRTAHSEDIHPLEISRKKGVMVHAVEEAYSGL